MYLLVKSSSFIFVSIFLCVEAYQAEVNYDGLMTISLHHALEPIPQAEFMERGRVTVQSIHGEASMLQQGALSLADRQKLKQRETLPLKKSGQSIHSLTATDNNSSETAMVKSSSAFVEQDLAKKDSLYRLKAVVRKIDGKETSFLTFVKACSLVESHLSDTLTLSLDHSGTVIAATLSTNAMCLGSYVDLDDLRHFNTSVAFKHTEQGPLPDTATYIQKMEREREARERGETKDNRSFLAKYWMYIVPVLIFVLLSGAVNPEGAAAGGGGGGGGGGGR